MTRPAWATLAVTWMLLDMVLRWVLVWDVTCLVWAMLAVPWMLLDAVLGWILVWDATRPVWVMLAAATCLVCAMLALRDAVDVPIPSISIAALSMAAAALPFL